jgi:universal stress protein E
MNSYAPENVEARSPPAPRRAVMGKILVVVDPTIAGSQPAVDKAARIAESCGASLQLYICDVEHQIPESWAGPSRASQYRDLRRQRFLDELNGLAAPMRARGQQMDIACEWHAPLEGGIGHHVIRTRPDLVVKGTLREHATSRAALTRTDWNLIRQIPASLLLVGPQPWRPKPHVAAAIDPSLTVEHPAHLDEALLEEGSELQNPPHLPGDPVSPQQKEDVHAQARLAAQRLGRRAGATAVRTTEGRATDGLVRLVEEHGPDVLVMGAVARPRWVHSAASGTAAQVLGRVLCDLLVVKPPGFISPLLVTED